MVLFGFFFFHGTPKNNLESIKSCQKSHNSQKKNRQSQESFFFLMWIIAYLDISSNLKSEKITYVGVTLPDSRSIDNFFK